MTTKKDMIQEIRERLGNETTSEQAEKAFLWLDEKLDFMRIIGHIEPARFLRDEVSQDDWNAMMTLLEKEAI